MLLQVISMVLWVISMLLGVISMLRMSDSWNDSSAHLTILIYVSVSSHQWHCRGAAYQVFQNSLQHCCPLFKMGWAPSGVETWWYQSYSRSWAEKWFWHYLGHWKVGWSEDIVVPVLLQYGCRTACQVPHKSNVFPQHGCRAACQVLNESNLYQQYDCRADCQVPNEWNLVSQHRCGGTCRVLRK